MEKNQYLKLKGLTESELLEVRQILKSNMDKVYKDDEYIISFIDKSEIRIPYSHLGFRGNNMLWLSYYTNEAYQEITFKQFKESFKIEKQIFRKGDPVFMIGTGWGVVVEMVDDFVTVDMENGGRGITKPDLLSFTEYTLQGFSQERPVDYNEYIGKLGMFWDTDRRRSRIGELDSYDSESEMPFVNSNGIPYQYFKPLTEEQIKILEL